MSILCVTNSFLRLCNCLFSRLCKTYLFRRYLYPTVFFISPLNQQCNPHDLFTLKLHKFSLLNRIGSLTWTYSFCALYLSLRSPYLTVFFNTHSLLNLINLSDSSIWISITECKLLGHDQLTGRLTEW